MTLSRARGRSRILVKVLLGTAVLVAASVVSLSGLFLMRHQTAFQQQFEVRAESLASYLAGQNQFPLLLTDRAELERAARTAVASSADVLYVIVEDASGHHIAGAARAPLRLETLPAGVGDIRLTAIRDLRIGPEATQCVEASAPVIPRAEDGLYALSPPQITVLGRVRVAMSLQAQHALFLGTLQYVVGIGLLILAATSVIAYFQIRTLLRPLVELSQVAQRFRPGGNESFHVVKRSNDETGVLVDSFNNMLEQVAGRTRELQEEIRAKERARAELVEVQQRLVDLSRQSGMAEVATNVLHNVGNVLNSVNVSVTIVAGKIKESRLAKLVAVVGMLQEHSEELGEFVRSDPKGRQTLPYLSKLGSHLQQEREFLLKELDLLTQHVGHIKQIVATQQSYAKVSGLIEDISLTALLEDALRIQQTGFDRHKVSLLREFEEIPQLATDKHRILQILLNLLSNARRAIADSGRSEGLIRVRIRRHREGRVRLEVKDSGVGLAPEQLTRIFAHGYTTKADGHGFGLHSGALAAKQLGGSLWAESEGPGLGATFTLELPLAATNSSEKDVYEVACSN